MSAGHDSPQPTLLIVDDEVRILSALRRSLRREGYRILTAESAQDALRVVDEQPVDVVMSDHKMPGMSGLDLMARIAKRQPAAARILITGWTEEITRDRLAELGIAALIPKPWDDTELRQILRRYLG